MGELNFGRMLRRAYRFSDREAVVDLAGDQRYSYEEHLDRVARLATVLGELAPNDQDSVAVLANAGHHYVELWRACCSGAAVINPLNTRLAPVEIVAILRDAGSPAIVVDAAHADIIDRLRPELPELRVVVLADAGPDDRHVPHDVLLSELLAVNDNASLPDEPAEDNAAVLMYTGGTTGRAKGVVLSQRAITLACYRMQPVVAVGGPQSFLSFMPMFHVGASSSWSFYLPIGGRTVILPGFDAGRINAAVLEEQITAIGAVPTMITLMLDHPDFEPKMFESLELVIYGGAAIPPSLLTRLMDVVPDVAIHQAYGMTEMSGIATALTAADHRIGGPRLQSVGRPALGVELELRHRSTGAPTPAGEVGEIWLKSDSMMTNYWNLPAETEAAVVDGWYRTGDAGRFDGDGYLYLADRVKDMIVTGGENVYSLEVERAITSHPSVIDAAVIGVPDAVWGERVHAVVQYRPPPPHATAPTAAELDGHTRALIAAYKVPKNWTIRSEPLPVSAAGKVLKRRLREELAAGTDEAR